MVSPQNARLIVRRDDTRCGLRLGLGLGFGLGLGLRVEVRVIGSACDGSRAIIFSVMKKEVPMKPTACSTDQRSPQPRSPSPPSLVRGSG